MNDLEIRRIPTEAHQKKSLAVFGILAGILAIVISIMSYIFGGSPSIVVYAMIFSGFSVLVAIASFFIAKKNKRYLPFSIVALVISLFVSTLNIYWGIDSIKKSNKVENTYEEKWQKALEQVNK